MVSYQMSSESCSVSLDSLWIVGPSRSGKTRRLVEYIGEQVWPQLDSDSTANLMILVFAATGDNRLDLDDRLTRLDPPRGGLLSQTTTPLGFCLNQVSLFWPQLMQQLEIESQFPMRLRPETEQEWASILWQDDLDSGALSLEGVSPVRLVRQLLDTWALAAASGVAIADIPLILEQGELGSLAKSPDIWPNIGVALEQWRTWCLTHGFLTYGLALDLYGQHLIGDRHYQTYLLQRYQSLCADDVDEYPAIMRYLFELFLDRDRTSLFTYNPDGGIRVGLNADPQYIAQIARRCHIEDLGNRPNLGLAGTLDLDEIEQVINPLFAEPVQLPPEQIQSLSTISRSQLLRETAETIIDAIHNQHIPPQDIAIIAPGLDDIARYTLIHILNQADISLRPLNEQRPLIASPLIRALLTLLTLVYPGLGRLVNREAIAEMLIFLSHPLLGTAQPNQPPPYWIDPVRAGLIADHCYVPDPDHPHLLDIQVFDRWDRLGYRPSTAYNQIRTWIETQKEGRSQRLLTTPLIFLDRAITRFFLNHTLPYDQLAAIRELMETAHHYWQIHHRLHPNHSPLAQFIQLLRQGAIAANPYPVRPTGPKANSVTLATIFQYRSSRYTHRWHFWLDASSPLWLKGGAANLWAAPLFLQHRLGQPWTVEHTQEADEERLRRILLDLLTRVEERLYLCHSDLAVNGTEQTGPLFALVSASHELNDHESNQF
ncbi:MAG: recombinase family protein [Roseofilum sp. Guam]|nr:recombinase family protein [Roseofilum sp. Guam]